ncbi:MAG: V-type ATP synthase subunit D [Acidobacteriota bacterium]
MSGPAIRSRVRDLRRELEAARNGRELLDRKRETLQRELARQQARRATAERRMAAAMAEARAALSEARAECGTVTLARAAFVQAAQARVAVGAVSLVGVRLPRLAVPVEPLPLEFGLDGSAASVDAGARAYAAALPHVVAFAEADTAVRRLAAALARTARRLNALDLRVLPDLVRDLRELTAAIEEEERDEAVRRRRWRQADGAM